MKKNILIFFAVIIAFNILAMLPDMLRSIVQSKKIEKSSEPFYYIDEFISDFTTYRSTGKELWNDGGIMSERVTREMNVIMALGNIFYNVQTDRNSEMIVKITEKDDYHIKKPTTPHLEYGLPYLIIIETFDTNYHDLKSYLEKDTRFVVANKRRRDY